VITTLSLLAVCLCAAAAARGIIAGHRNDEHGEADADGLAGAAIVALVGALLSAVVQLSRN
jgi:hypothetical protein